MLREFIRRFSEFAQKDITKCFPEELDRYIREKYGFSFQEKGLPNIMYAGPTGMAAGDMGLVLQCAGIASPTVGEKVEISLYRKKYRYEGNQAIPMGLDGLGVITFCYALTEADEFRRMPEDIKYKLCIPFSKFIAGESMSLSDVIDRRVSNFNQLLGCFSVMIRDGTFTYNGGAASVYRYWHEAFFRKMGYMPEIQTMTPENKATAVPLEGSVVITFSRQMDKNVRGSIVLSDYGTLEEGSWSDDGYIYTAEYSGLVGDREYSVEVSGFRDPDGNEKTEKDVRTFTT